MVLETNDIAKKELWHMAPAKHKVRPAAKHSFKNQLTKICYFLVQVNPEYLLAYFSMF